MDGNAGEPPATAAGTRTGSGGLPPWLPAVCMFLLLTLAFAHSCRLRAYWFGRLNMEHHHWLTGITLLFTRNWYHEGPFHLHWLMLDAPKSVEFRTLSDRYPYISCPPGPAIP